MESILAKKFKTLVFFFLFIFVVSLFTFLLTIFSLKSLEEEEILKTTIYQEVSDDTLEQNDSGNLQDKEQISDNSLYQEILDLTKEEDYSIINLKLGEKIIKAEVVFSSSAKFLGLSGRDSLGEDEAMLFVFDDLGDRTFVMRNMNFPIDIVFIKNAEVKKVFKSLRPEGSYPEEKYSYGLVDMVLELPANYFDNNNLSEGIFLELVD